MRRDHSEDDTLSRSRSGSPTRHNRFGDGAAYGTCSAEKASGECFIPLA